MSLGIPGFLANRRRTVRGAVNPMDKSTVFSIYPRVVKERKHTIEPGLFEIPAGTLEKPSCLVVGSSSWWKEIDEEQQLLEIVNGSVQVANAIVSDYCRGIFGCNMATAMPGLFWVPGEFTTAQLKTEKLLAVELKKANEKQNSWYNNLIRLTDALWARTNGNPLVVSDDARLAAKQLNLTGKDWMKDLVMMAKSNCPACGSPRDSAYPVCPTCKHVDLERAKELGLVFALDTTPQLQKPVQTIVK